MNRLLSWLNNLIKKRRELRRWQKIVTLLAAIITFATTYALILPAITVERDKAGDVGGMYLEEGAERDDLFLENALEPDGISIDADREAAYEDEITGDIETDAEIPDNGYEDEGAANDASDTGEGEAAPEMKTLKTSGSDYTVTLTFDAASKIPEGAALAVSEIAQDSEEYSMYLEETKKAMGLTEEETLPRYAARFFDIKIMVGEEEFTPESGVSVEIAYAEPLAENPDTEVSAVHFADETAEAEVIEANTTEVQTDGAATVEFTAESFSVYGVVYTVDFHWEVDGEMFEFSLRGGDSISIRELLRVLRVVDEEEKTDDGSNALDKFVSGIEAVEFSDPELVWVGKIAAAMNAGQIAEAYGLDIEYSEELPGSQIAELSEKAYEPGEWVLLSVKPFDTTETLLVTMKTGEKFEIIVTDARDTIGLAGRTASIVTENGGNKALVVNNGSIAMTDTTVLKEDGSGLGAGESIYSLAADTSLYSNQSDTAWTFEYDEATGGYHISNQGKYLKIVGNQLQYAEAQVVDGKIIKPTVYVSKNREIDQESARTDSAGNTLYSYTWTDWDGTYLLSDAPAYTVDKDTQKLTPNSDATYLASNGTISADRNNAAMLVLCMPEDPTKDVRKASLVHAGDLSDGEDIIIYKKIWNNSKDNYDYYAIDINGEPVRVYDSSDSVYWKKQGDEFPKIEWTLEEGTNEDGSPSGYLYLTQTNESGETVYLCPQYDGYVVRTLGPDEDKTTVGISLPGRNDNTEGSRISAWDYDANVTCGVYLERDPEGNGIRSNEGDISDSVVVKRFLESDEFQFAVRDPRVQKQLTTVETVGSKAKGITITMFDFDGNQGHPDGGDDNKWGRYSSDRLKWMTEVIGRAGWASGEYETNLVEQILGSDGYPVPTNSSHSTLKDIFEPQGNARYGYKIENGPIDANHLFIQSVYDSTGYFYYSGFDNFARLGDDGNFTVYEQLGTPQDRGQFTTIQTDGTIGPSESQDSNFFFYRGNFMPFSDLNLNKDLPNYYKGGDFKEKLDADDPRRNEDLYLVQNKPGTSSPDYYFGMIMETKFQQGKDGLSDRGDPMVFEFTGDDDMWVYVDDVLLMDIGGIHDAFHGKINFKTGRITIDAQNTTNPPTGFTYNPDTKQFVSTIREQYKSAGRLPNNKPWNDADAEKFFIRTGSGESGTYRDYSEHALKMFYMERGKGASNLQIEFNLPVITGDQFMVSKEMPRTVEGNAIQSKYADAAFYYQAEYSEEISTDVYGDPQPVTYAEFKDTAHYSDGTPVVWKEELVETTDESGNTIRIPATDGSGNVIYTNKFEIKPGQIAIFPVSGKKVKYKVTEVEPETDSHMLDNFSIYVDGRQTDTSAETTVQEHGRVNFENLPAENLVNDLQIVKELHGSLYPDSVAKETGSRYFEYRIFLEATSGKMQPYSLGEYYQIDGETGKYVYYDPDKPGKDKRCLADYDESTGLYTYVYAGGTETTDKPKITEHTSINGTVGDIRPGDRLIIKGLMEGTSFIVDERVDRSNMTDTREGDWTNKYLFDKTDVENAFREGDPVPWQKGSLFDPTDESGINYSQKAAKGAIMEGRDRDALVTVHNEVNSIIPVRKQWPEAEDGFDLDELREDAQVKFVLKRLRRVTKTANLQVRALVDPDEIDQRYIIKDAEGNTLYTISYDKMNIDSGTDMAVWNVSLPVGTYTVSRSEDPNGYTVDHENTPDSYTVTVSDTDDTDDLNVSIQNGEEAADSVTFISRYTLPSRKITVDKTLQGWNGSYNTFKATYTLLTSVGKPAVDRDGNPVQSRTLTLGSSGITHYSFDFDNLKPGKYIVKEEIDTSSANDSLYSMARTPDTGTADVDVSEENGEAAFVTTYTKVETDRPKVKVNVYHIGKAAYDAAIQNQATSPDKLANERKALSVDNEFYVGQMVEIRWTRKQNAPGLSYMINGGEVVPLPQNTAGQDKDVYTEYIRREVPEGGIEMYFFDGNGQPTADNVTVSAVSSDTTAAGTSTSNSTGRFSAASAARTFSGLNAARSARTNAALKAAGLLGAGDETTYDVAKVTNGGDNPKTEAGSGTKYEEDADNWSLTVIMKRGEAGEEFQIIDESGNPIAPGTFVQDTDKSDWLANLTGIDLADDEGNPYYYYIASVEEENLSAPMKATIIMEDDGTKYLYSQADQVNRTGRVLTVVNDIINAYGDVSLVKADTDDTVLEGAEFALYRSYKGGELLYPLQEVKPDGEKGTVIARTGEDGVISFENVPAGTWYLKEVKAPEGFKLSPNIYKVVITIKEGQEDELNPETETKVTILGSDEVLEKVINTPITYGEVEFEKQDSDGAGLDGAVFGLFTDAGCSRELKIDESDITATSRNRGKVKFSYERDKDGKTVVGIESGDYYMKEITAPDGYKLNEQKYFVHIGDGTEEDTSFIALLEENPQVGNMTLEQYYRDRSKMITSVMNEPVRITVRKVDEENKPLTGARFTLTRTGDAGAGVTKPGAGETDKAVYEFSPLVDGDYTLHETAPTGYQAADDVTFRIEEGVVVDVSSTSGVLWDGESFTFTVTNTPEDTPGELTVRKQWLDFFGNATDYKGTVDIKLTQWVKANKVTFYIRCTGNGKGNDSFDFPGQTTPIAERSGTGMGNVTIQWDWDQWTEPKDFDVDGLQESTYTQSVNGKRQTLTIQNVTQDLIVYVTIRNRSWLGTADDLVYQPTFADGSAAESGMIATGGTKTVRLGESGVWSQKLDVNGDGRLSELSTKLPATYNGSECFYSIAEESVPDGFTLQQISGDKVQHGVLTAYNKKNTIDLEIQKVDVNNTSKKLNGAEFTLKMLDISQPGVHYPSGAGETKKTTAGSGANAGKLTFDNLGSGYYEIRESKVPNGYVISEDDKFYVKITEEGVFMIRKDDSKTADHWDVISKYGMVTFDADNAQAAVTNEPGAALPHTGGPGTALLYILGSIMVLGAGMLLWRRRRLI